MQTDIRGTAIYKEASELYEKVSNCGTGIVASAVELSASEDGRVCAFTGSIASERDSNPVKRICLLTAYEDSIRIVSQGPNDDLSPKTSADGRFIAYRSDCRNKGRFELFVLNVETGVSEAIPTLPGWVEYCHWSADGARLLIGIAAHGADVAGAAGAVKSEEIPDKATLEWMPQVDTGDFRCHRRSVWTLETASGQIDRASPSNLNIWEACWCGADTIAALVSDDPRESHWYSARLATIDLPKGAPQTLYQPNDQIGQVTPSPNGRFIAFIESICSDRGVIAGQLKLLDRTGNRKLSIDTGNVDVTCIDWRSKTGFVFTGRRGNDTVVGEVDVAADEADIIWSSEHLASGTDYYPRVCAVGGHAGDCVFIAEGFTTPAKLYQLDNGKLRERYVFEHGDPQPPLAGLGAIEAITWTAPDGLEIQGWLLRPHGQGPHPLLMEIHGGPVWQRQPRLITRSLHNTMLARRGFAIFWPNVRGSSGFGQDYIRQVQGDMGGKDTTDFLSGIDYLVKRGIADPDRLCVSGGSYGGYMTLWLITQDQRFAAAIPVSPIANWVSQHFSANIPHFDELFLGARYNERHSKHLQRSPVMFADNVRTPTMQICGALDRCTPAGQALEFHNALLAANKTESLLVTYPKEGHGVRNLPTMIDCSARIVMWLERHCHLN